MSGSGTPNVDSEMPIAPTKTADAERWYSALTPSLLTSALRADGLITTTEVVDRQIERVGTGQVAQSLRVTLIYDGAESGAPTSVIAKLPSQDANSLRMASDTGAYLREVRFYQELANTLAVRCPAAHHTHLANETDFLLLLEDVGPAVSGDQLRGCSVDQAALAMEQAAALHASSWHDPRLTSTSWLPGVPIWRRLAGTLPQGHRAFLERFGAGLTDEQAEIIETLSREVELWLTAIEEPRCLWHGDFRLDNMLFNAKDREVPIVVVDWQTVMPGPGIIDTSYFLGTSITEELRAEAEAELVRLYHQALLDRGVNDYSWDQCWREYQMHAVFTLVMTIPAALGVEQNKRGDEMFLKMAQRGTSQIAALDSFSALRASAR
ncbi:Phosphotransferase enzyme family protein [Mycobacterium sp. THAF192]|nr:Phosphotransferase enzyme family protein [Mycobacterium sp. THAF192]